MRCGWWCWEGCDRASAWRKPRRRSSTLTKLLVKQYPEAHQGRNEVSAFPLWRAPYGANAYRIRATADAAGDIGNRLVARLRERGEFAAGAVGGAAARDGDSDGDPRKPRATSAATFDRESGAVARGRGGGDADHHVVGGAFGSFIPPTNIPIFLDAHADRTVLLVTLAVSMLTGVIFGILPAVRSSNLAPVAVLKEDTGSASGGRHKARLSSGLVVVQIALSLLLLVCAGLFVRSFQNAQRTDMGFNPDHVLLATVDLFSAGYTKEQGLEFDPAASCEAREPARRAVGEHVELGAAGFSSSSSVSQPEGYVPRPHESMDIPNANVGPNYLRTMQIPLVKGREFTAQDTETSQTVAVVNQELDAQLARRRRDRKKARRGQAISRWWE